MLTLYQVIHWLPSEKEGSYRKIRMVRRHLAEGARNFLKGICQVAGSDRNFPKGICQVAGGIRNFRSDICQVMGGARNFPKGICQVAGGARNFRSGICQVAGGDRNFWTTLRIQWANAEQTEGAGPERPEVAVGMRDICRLHACIRGAIVAVMADSVNNELEASNAESPPSEKSKVPRMYRAMKPDATGGAPMIGRANLMLGARVPRDIQWIDETLEQVGPGKGMSVNRSIQDIYPAFLPRRLKHLNRNATGNDNVRIFRFGQDAFVSGAVSPKLNFRPDHGRAPTHGEIEPSQSMSLREYQEALEQTKDNWMIDET